MTTEHSKPALRSQLRVSHADRDAVVEQLREAAGDGRIDLSELESRVEQALTAKTFADLAPLTVDLPPAEVPDTGRPLVVKGGIHGAKRAGRWQVPARITVYGGVGSAKLDFTRTDCRLPVVELEVHGQVGGVTVVVPLDWAAETDGVNAGIGGLKDKTTPDRLTGTPLIRLTGSGGMGGVVIRHPNILERRTLNRDNRR